MLCLDTVGTKSTDLSTSDRPKLQVLAVSYHVHVNRWTNTFPGRRFMLYIKPSMGYDGLVRQAGQNKKLRLAVRSLQALSQPRGYRNGTIDN